MHKGLGFQPERGEQERSGGYCNWFWRISHKEAQCWFQQEYTKSHPPQDPFQRDIQEMVEHSGQRAMSQSAQRWRQVRGKDKRRHPGKGNHNQDQSGSPDEETGQCRLEDFGVKRQRVEFVEDVQDHTRMILKHLQWIEKLMYFAIKSARVSWRIGRNCQVRRGEFFSGVQWSEEPADTHETTPDQSTGEVLFVVGCRFYRPIVASGSIMSTFPVDYATSVSDWESPLQYEFGECAGWISATLRHQA